MRTLTIMTLVAALVPPCGAGVLTVDCTGGGDFATVQAAADAAASGDTILIAPCIYTEQVVVTGKCLTLVGAGPDVTEIAWSGDGPVFDFELMPEPQVFKMRDLSISRSPSSETSIWWNTGKLELEACEVEGSVIGLYDASVRVVDSSATRLEAYGGFFVSRVYSSVVGDAVFIGFFDPWYGQLSHNVVSENSEFGSLDFGLGSVTLTSSSVGLLTGESDHSSHGYASVNASSCVFGQIQMTGCGTSLSDCLIEGDLTVVGSHLGSLDASSCTVLGDIQVDVSLDELQLAYLSLEHNTVLGSVSCAYWLGDSGWVMAHRLRSNIVQGATTVQGDWNEVHPVVTHNDFVGGHTVAVPSDSVFANVSADPLFCGEQTGDLSLQVCSPCVGSAHDGGDIGRFGVGCECVTPIEAISWGRLKALFRQPSN